MVLGAGEERQGPAESTGDPEMGCRQSLPWRLRAQAARPDGGRSSINEHSSTSLASSSPLWTVSKVPPASFSRGTCHLHYLTSDSDPALTFNTLLFLQKCSSRRRYISHSFCFLLLHEKGRNKGRNLLLTPAPVVQTHQRIPSPLRSQSVAYIILQHTR